MAAKETMELTGINEEMIHRLIYIFYARIREDEILAPIFEAVISDWPTHLERMCAFWSSVAIHSRQYQGRPMEKHLSLPVDSQHFDRWIALFDDTTRMVCGDVAAEHTMARTRRIAESLELGIAGNSGVLLAKAERLKRPELANRPRNQFSTPSENTGKSSKPTPE